MPPFGADHYVPILRAKQGEMQALEHADPTVRNRMTPLVDLAVEEGDEVGVVDRLVPRLRDGWGASDRVIVDASALGDATTSGNVHVVSHLHSALRSGGVISVPTAWLTSTSDQLAAIRDVLLSHRSGLCLRITVDDLSDVQRLPQNVMQILATVGGSPDDTDMIIDVGAIDAVTIGLHSALLAVVLPAIPHVRDWRSFTLASGSFPANLDAFRPYVPGVAPRLDAQLWLRASAATQPRRPGYGDYTVTHPVAMAAGPWRGAPNLRYTRDSDWLVVKGRVNSPRGNYEFHDICAQVAAVSPSPLLSASFSWGDEEIQRCVLGSGGPGGGTQWRAWATSHHLTVVTERLASLGVP